MFRKIVIVLSMTGIFGAAILAMIMLHITGPKPDKKEEDDTTPEVIAVEIDRSDVQLYVTSQGEVRAKQEIALVPQISGKISDISDSFAAGGKFEKGDLLVKIEQADYRLAVTRAKATVAQAKQRLAFEKAQSDLAKREWDELGDGEATALTLRQPQLAESRALYDAALAELRSAELNLRRTIIRAPFSGRVRSRSVGLGQFVSVGTPLGQIFSTDIVEIKLPLSDLELAELGIPLAYVASGEEKGWPVSLTADVSGKNLTWTAHIKRTDASIDSATRQLFAIAEYEDPYGTGMVDNTPLAVGLYVDARIKGRLLDNIWRVPRQADRGGRRIPVVSGEDKVVYRDVNVETKDDEWVYIRDGLQADDQVILSDLVGIRSDTEVKVVRPFDYLK